MELSPGLSSYARKRSMVKLLHDAGAEAVLEFPIKNSLGECN